MNERVIWQGGEHHYTIKGTLADWTNGIAALAGEHQIPRFMVAAAFAGPLLVPGNCESGLFHFHGFSSRGKTISLRAAASVWGDPHDGKYVRNWRTTANALETTLAMCCDTFLPIDETGQANPKDIQTVAYEIGGGAGKARMSRDATAKPTLTWRVLAGSTGEKPIAEILREKDAVAAAAGQLVRAVDVAVPENALGEAGRRTAEKIEAAAYENHGTAGRAFVRRIIDGGLNHGGEIRRG